MRGVIKSFNNEKGFGFISGDSEDLFFHISSLMNKDLIPCVGMGVEYDVGSNKKGHFAFNIEVVENVKPVFIKFGDDRIKLSNIKDYGIADGSEELLKRLKSLEYNLASNEQHLDSCKNTEYLKEMVPCAQMRYDDSKEEVEKLKQSIFYKQALANDLKYLYITTYQNDNYRYYLCECDFDINEKLAILDKYLCE